MLCLANYELMQKATPALHLSKTPVKAYSDRRAWQTRADDTHLPSISN